MSIDLRRRLSLVTQPLILFPLLTLIVLGVVWVGVFHLLRVERAGAEREAAVLTRELVETYEAQVVRALREIDQTLRILKYSFEAKHPPSSLEELKARGILPPELLFDVKIADRAGNIVATTRSEDHFSVTDEAYFGIHRDRKTDTISISQPPRGPTGGSMLHFSRRLDAPDGSFAGVATISVNADYFVSVYDEEKLGKFGVLGILGLDGVFRVRRTGDDIYSGDEGNYIPLLPHSDSVGEDTVRTISSWDGVARYARAYELYDFPVVVLVGVAEVEQLAQVNRQRQKYILAASGGSFVLVLVLAVLGRMTWQLARSRQRESEATVEHAKRVEYLAYHDGLTGLPNRGLFSKLLTQSISQAQRYNRQLAVMFIDLDRFKGINDTLGHDAGDQLLQEVARRLKACLRESDTVARLGGDEFVIMLPELTGEGDIAVVSGKVLTATAQPFILLGHEFRVTASIGIAIYPHDGLDEQTLTKNADIAMYHAKDEGKNNFQMFSKALSEDALQRLTLESSLRQALEREEFELHYQAKRDIDTDTISGMEALLRWRHPELGIVAPMQFIPLAEETGLILPIGKWVLKTACAQNVAWQRQGFPALSIAVNLTARQFFDEHLLQYLVSVFEATDMLPQFLELEITENLLMRDVDAALKVIVGLKSLGVRIAIDDFGVGYSSLATLQKFPLDTVKIDRSYIGDAATEGTDSSLTAAIIAVGRSLSLTVVAQGVETKEQADSLRKRSCNEFQGFYFDKPVPAEQFEMLLQLELKKNASIV